MGFSFSSGTQIHKHITLLTCRFPLSTLWSSKNTDHFISRSIQVVQPWRHSFQQLFINTFIVPSSNDLMKSLWICNKILNAYIFISLYSCGQTSIINKNLIMLQYGHFQVLVVHVAAGNFASLCVSMDHSKLWLAQCCCLELVVLQTYIYKSY